MPTPGRPDDELADLASNGISVAVDDVGIHPDDRSAERRRLLRHVGVGDDDAPSDLRPAGVVDDRSSLPADNIVRPAPWPRIPGLAGRADGP